MRRLVRLAALGAAVVATACSSSGVSTIPNGPGSPGPPPGQTQVTFVVSVPGGERPHFVSPSTQSVVVTLGQSAVVTIDTWASSSACKAGTAGSRICSAQAIAPSGRQVFDLTAYDGASGNGNVLATGQVSAHLTPGKPAHVRVALTGRPASLQLSIRDAYPPAGKSGTFGVALEALDADGNTILGSYGTTIALSDSDGSGATKLSTASVNASSQKVSLTYDGTPLAQAVVSAQTAGLRAASVIFAPTPTIVAQYAPPPINGFLPAGVADLCIGPDGNIWATASSSGGIERMTPDGKYTTFTNHLEGSDPLGISRGPDGNLWFVEELNGKLAKITPHGKVTAYKIPVEPSGFSQPASTAPGPDGRVWFLDQGSPPRAGASTPDGTLTMYALPAKSFPQEIVTGPDGNLWVTDDGYNGVLVLSPSGKVIAKHRVKTADAQPWGITVGPDKNIWVAEYNVDKIARITLSGAVREFILPTAVAGPLNVASGPDGNVWFTESGGGIGIAGKIGYVKTDGSLIRDFPMKKNVDHAHNLAFDSNGNLWFTEFNGPESAIGKLVY